MTTQSLSEGLKKIFAEDAQLETIASDCIFTEGTLWHHTENYLLFSDMPGDKMRKWTPAGGVEIFRAPCGKSNGLTFDKQGRLLACEHANRRVSRTSLDGSIEALATQYQGKSLNSPNDIVVKSDGSIYFTDPTYGLSKEYGVEGEQELAFQGVYRIDPSGELTLLADDFGQPNGLCFSKDESVLYVNDTPGMHVRRFTVKDDGTLSGGEVVCEVTGTGAGPDGLKIDTEENLYTTGPGGMWIFNPQFELLGVYPVPGYTANFNWGGADLKTFYICATDKVYRIPVKIAGLPCPR